MIKEYVWNKEWGNWENLVRLDAEAQGLQEVYLHIEAYRNLPYEIPRNAYIINGSGGITTYLGFHIYPRYYKVKQELLYEKEAMVPYRPFVAYTRGGHNSIYILDDQCLAQKPIVKTSDTPW